MEKRRIRSEIRPGDLGEDEALHEIGKQGVVWSFPMLEFNRADIDVLVAAVQSVL
ncbi:MAG: hypothetical protein R2712_11055 [Vicinamibacterales bacterium]